MEKITVKKRNQLFEYLNMLYGFDEWWNSLPMEMRNNALVRVGEIIEGPPNTQMQPNQEPCNYCNTAKKSEYFDGFSYCPECGLALDR